MNRTDGPAGSGSPAGPCAPVVRTAALLGVLSWIACGGAGPTGPGASPDLEIVLSGWPERSAQSRATLERDGVPVPAADVTWSLDPPDRGQVEEEGEIHWLSAGPVTIRAFAAGASAELDVRVAVPPRIVFDLRREGSRDIYAATLDGQDLERLTSDPAEDLNPSAAGGVVVFTSYRTGVSETWSIPVDGGTATRLTDPGTGDFDPDLDAAGDRLAFVRENSVGVPKLWSAEGDGSGPERLTAGHGFEGSVENGPSWNPDGTRLVFVSTAAGSADLVVHDPEAGTFVPLGSSSKADVEPAWSPDGATVAFASNRDGDTELYLADVRSGKETRITHREGADGRPAWLPDGRLVYVAWTASGDREICWLDPAEPATAHPVPLDGDGPDNPHGIFP